MPWNHRVIRHEQDDGGMEYRFYAIHEVYYDKGEITGWTRKATHPFGETIAELMDDIRRFNRASRLPILAEKDGKLVEVNE